MAFLLALALLALSACGSEAEELPAPEETAGALPGEELGIGDAADEVFTLNYTSSQSLNPYATNDLNNLLISQLVFENIYELDDDYNLTSRIIKEYSMSSNGIQWTFTINEGIPMHDGSTMTAYDVAYSIQQALRTSRYSGRFDVWGVGASSDSTFVVTTARANTLFNYLLTIPVIKNGSGGEPLPAGSGPYMYVEGADYVQAFGGYGASVPIERIYFKEYVGTENIITAFEDSYIDLVINDPSSKANLGYGGNTERRWYTTTNMHYLGFNMSDELLANPTVRCAIALAVDRDYAAEELLQGGAVASVLPISPHSPLYDESIASQYDYDLATCGLMLTNAGLSDMDNDGKLEYVSYSVMHDAAIDIIVCSQSSGKGDVCKKLAEDLGALGVQVNVRELSWNDYLSALRGDDIDGDGEPDISYDMYYAEVKLGADFDLTDLLSVEGSLNYGGIEDENYADYINAYLASSSIERSTRCADMLRYILSNAPIVPICFEQQEVITHRNVITGMEVSSSDIFMTITDWNVRFSDEEG